MEYTILPNPWRVQVQLWPGHPACLTVAHRSGESTPDFAKRVVREAIRIRDDGATLKALLEAEEERQNAPA